MADKRISQLVDRGTVANNDVVPIVVSGATTTNKATISSIQTFMQSNLDVGVTSVGITIGSTGTDVNVTGSPVTSSGNITINLPTASAANRGLLSSADWTTFNNKVSSVGLSMPSAFSVANSPITGSGTIAVTGAGTVAQYIRGDGSLADFPSGGGGGGASVSYYLNGSVSQGTIGGIAYREMNKVPVLGAGTDFVAIADGYLASFITDAGDPNLLEIPAGNWNFETYFSASSGGGSPSFYIELYKVNSGGTATLIASNSATPELISFGTSISPYFSPLAVPTTVLTVTDRLAVRYYVARSGRTITLHTENSHLCQIITTFTTGLTALNGLTAQVQNFATGTSGTDFSISSSVSTHTFNLPDASASARGVVTTGTQTFAGAKTFNSTTSHLGTASFGSGGPTAIDGSDGRIITDKLRLYNVNPASAYHNITSSASANRDVNFPNASGTVALTTDLGAYLPLAGGTLTGALNGTSATFGSTNGIITANRSTTSFASLFKMSTAGVDNWSLGIPTLSSADWVLFNHATNISNLSFASATGAATFSSSVTASSLIKSGGTSSQFLKADGSVDSNTYLTSASGLTGSGTFGTIPKFLTANTIGDSDLTNISGKIVNLNPPSGQFSWQFNGNTTTGQSYGPLVYAGTNASDTSFECRNIALTSLFKVRGDGVATFNNSVSGTSIRSSGVGSFGFNTANNGEFQMYSSANFGLVMAGRGAIYDLIITNKNGGDTFRIPTDTTNVEIVGNVLIGGTAGALRLGTNAGDFATFNYSGGGTSVRNDWASTSAFLDLLANSVGFRVNGTGNATLTGTLTQGVSDMRFKKNIEPILNAIQKIKSINGYTFDYDLDNKDLTFVPKEGRDIGVIAQEIELVIPEAVSVAPVDRNDEGESKSGKNYLTVNYEKIIPLLIQGIKEQQEQIEKLETEIDSLKNQIK